MLLHLILNKEFKSWQRWTLCWWWNLFKKKKNNTQQTYNTALIWSFLKFFQCVIWVCGGLMFDSRVPQRVLCDKRCLDIDLKASQELLRRESPPRQQPAIPWRWCSESPWTEATCLLWVCCLLFRRWKQINQKQLKKSWVFCCCCVFWGFLGCTIFKVFTHVDAVYPFINS